MDQLGILGLNKDPSQKLNPVSVRGFPIPSIPQGRGERVRFPGDDNHKSLAQMAKSDLEAALQLLADRAQYITGASGSAIALRENDKMVCRASVGSSAPAIGTLLQMDSGLTGESVREKKLMRCDDVETDVRVNRESCRALGIVSVVVLPLIKDEQVIGLFELLSEKAYAFEERDINAVERLGEMIQTALEVEPDTKPFRTENSPSHPMTNREKSVSDSQDSRPVIPINPQIVAQLHATIGKCASCGFPVSEGRKYCLDCESSPRSDETSAVSNEAPDFLASYSNQKQKNWFSRNIYWIGIVAMSLGTVALLLLKSK